jgi:hypothetical protein
VTLNMTVLKMLFFYPLGREIINILLDNKYENNEVRDNLFSAGLRYWFKVNKTGCIATRPASIALRDSYHSC